MSKLAADVRPYVLLTLWLAERGGETSLDRATILKRIRTSAWPGNVIESAVIDLKLIGFVKTVDDADSYGLTSAGRDWLASRYDLEKGSQTQHFMFKRGGEDLPAPSQKYLELLPRTNWRRFWISMAFVVALVAISQFLAARG